MLRRAGKQMKQDETLTVVYGPVVVDGRRYADDQSGQTENESNETRFAEQWMFPEGNQRIPRISLIDNQYVHSTRMPIGLWDLAKRYAGQTANGTSVGLVISQITLTDKYSRDGKEPNRTVLKLSR